MHKVCGLVGIDSSGPFIHIHVRGLYGLVMLFKNVIKVAKAFDAWDINGFDINIVDIESSNTMKWNISHWGIHIVM